jgi:hypothetical protein
LFCKCCGRKNPSDARFCSGCGVRLDLDSIRLDDVQHRRFPEVEPMPPGRSHDTGPWKALEDVSGAWDGSWKQGPIEARMMMTLSFRNGAITGQGVDRAGDFTVEGTYSPSDPEISFRKRYPTHKVFYRGLWDGHELKGDWEIKSWLARILPGGKGSFLIWPILSG